MSPRGHVPPPYGLSTQREESRVLHVSRRRNPPPQPKEKAKDKKGSGQMVYGLDSMVSAVDVRQARERKAEQESMERAAAHRRNAALRQEEERREQQERGDQQRRNQACLMVLNEQVRERRERQEMQHLSEVTALNNSLEVIPERPQLEDKTAKRQIQLRSSSAEYRHVPSRRMIGGHPAQGHSSEQPPHASPLRRPFPHTPSRTPFDTYDSNPSYPELAPTGERNKFCHTRKAHTQAQAHYDQRLGRRTHTMHNESTVPIAVKETPKQSRFSRRPAPHDKVQPAAERPQPASLAGRRRAHSAEGRDTRPW